MIPKILIINAVRLICLVCLILRKFYNLACRLAALSYQLESRALKCENKNKLCEPVCVGGGMMSGRGLGNQQPILQKQSAFISARLFLLGIWKWVLSRRLVRVIGMGSWGKVTEKLQQIGKRFVKLVIINTFILSSSTRMSITSIVSKPSIIYQLNIIRQVKLKISELLFKPIISSRSTFYAFGSSNYNFDKFFIGIGNIWGMCLFFISSAIMLSLMIYLTLLAQGIERQPGPVSKRSTLSILTYNCNGLGDPKKLKRLLLKLNVLVNKGCIVFLQETHIVDTKYLEMIWKHSFLSNCIKTNSAGVIILYNKQYDLVHEYSDG
jgi:hypothetical protein